MLHQTVHLLPRNAPLFAVSSEAAVTASRQFSAEVVYRSVVGWDCVVLGKAAKDLRQPLPLFGDGPMQTLAHFNSNCMELALHAFCHAVSHQEVSSHGKSANCSRSPRQGSIRRNLAKWCTVEGKP